MPMVKDEVLRLLPQGKVSYPVAFPSRIQYSIVDWGLLKIKVIANSIRA